MGNATVTATIGRIVLYKLTKGDAATIIARRKQAGGDGDLGDHVRPGDTCPAIVVRAWGTSVNLQVFLDGPDFYWATSRTEGMDEGHWMWPALQPSYFTPPSSPA